MAELNPKHKLLGQKTWGLLLHVQELTVSLPKHIVFFNH
jgi:hypothetical protein